LCVDTRVVVIRLLRSGDSVAREHHGPAPLTGSRKIERNEAAWGLEVGGVAVLLKLEPVGLGEFGRGGRLEGLEIVVAGGPFQTELAELSGDERRRFFELRRAGRTTP